MSRLPAQILGSNADGLKQNNCSIRVKRQSGEGGWMMMRRENKRHRWRETTGITLSTVLPSPSDIRGTVAMARRWRRAIAFLWRGGGRSNVSTLWLVLWHTLVQMGKEWSKLHRKLRSFYVLRKSMLFSRWRRNYVEWRRLSRWCKMT